MKYRNCPICDGNITFLLQNVRLNQLDGISLPDKYDLEMCLFCGMVFADTKATQKEYNKFYQENIIYENEASYSDIEKSKLTFELLANRWDRNESILEIGFASGVLLRIFKEAGYKQLFGLDPNQKCVDHISQYGIQALTGNIGETMVSRKFNRIILSHVVEHILDLPHAFTNIRKMLTPNGQVYIEVPNLDQYGEYYSPFYNYFYMEHVNHFNLRTLSNTLITNGLNIVDEGVKRWSIGRSAYYPAIWIIGTPAKERIESITEVGPGEMTNVIQIVENYFSHKISEIERLINAQEEVIVWGTGGLTHYLFTMGKLAHCNIRMYVDNNPDRIGKSFGKKIICSPESITTNHKILVLSVYHAQKIVNQIRDMGLPNETIMLK